MIKIGTLIPKAKVFRFENFWMQHRSFKDVVSNAWSIPVGFQDRAKKISAKFKNLRRALKQWAKNLSCLKLKIEQLNECIFLFDLFEEYMALSNLEWRRRVILKEELLTLLKNQKIYWKQRGKIKGVNFGDENTKKNNHARATINHRHNHIAVLQNEDQVDITEHEGKAAILWNASRKRLGTSEKTTMHFDIQSLCLHQHDPAMFEDLEKPFTNQEINDVVKELPNDKSPGPDGFNNEFYKSCWDIIGPDIRNLIHEFHGGNINLESINSSFITLIPKTDTPLNPNDYRPISLLNSYLKIITKLLENRLQKIILKLIHIK